MLVRFLLILSVLSYAVFAGDVNCKLFLDDEQYDKQCIWNPQCSRYELNKKQWCEIQEIAPEAIKDGSQLAIKFTIPGYSPTTLTATVREQCVETDFKSTYTPDQSMEDFLASLKGKCFATREYMWNQAQDGIKQKTLRQTSQIPRIEFSKPHQLLYFYGWSSTIDKVLHKTDIFIKYGFLPPDDPALANQEIDKLLKRKLVYTFHHDLLNKEPMKDPSGEDILEMDPCGLLRSIYKVEYAIKTPKFIEWKNFKSDFQSVNNDLQSLEPYSGFVTEEGLTTGIAIATDRSENLSGYITRDTSFSLFPKSTEIVYYSCQDTFHLCVSTRGRYQFRENIDEKDFKTIFLTVACPTPIQLALPPHATFDEHFQSGSYYLLECPKSSETATSQGCRWLNSTEPFKITITSPEKKKEPFAVVDLTEALSDLKKTVQDVFSILKQTFMYQSLLQPWSRLLEINLLGKSADQQQLIIQKYLNFVGILYANGWKDKKNSALQIKKLNQLPLTQLDINHTNFDVVNLLLYLQSNENYKNPDQQIETMIFNLSQLDSSKFPDYPNQVVNLIQQFKAKKVTLKMDILELVNQKSTQPLINFILSQQTTTFNLNFNTVAFVAHNSRDSIRPYTDGEMSILMRLIRGVEKVTLDAPLASLSQASFITLLKHNRETLRELCLTKKAVISPVMAQELISIIPHLSNHKELKLYLGHLYQENSTALKPIIPVLQKLKNLKALDIVSSLFRMFFKR
ncbi:MAG: hypothetical protein K0M45_11930 [Candidatus Paracaedibacteraceae bacterium]|nr:hypothetical protein [Candidatus Paracaedibacteraceae bacterium]